MSARKQRVEAERVSPTAVNAIKVFTEITNHIIEHGFVYYDRMHYQHRVSVLSSTYLFPYAKQVCKELGRPWVRATGGWFDYYEYARDADGNYKSQLMGKRFAGKLLVPKRDYLAPVVAPLLMVASQDRYAPVVNYSGKSNWEFHFTSNNESSAEIWENHINFMRTDPEARKALKVLPK